MKGAFCERSGRLGSLGFSRGSLVRVAISMWLWFYVSGVLGRGCYDLAGW